MSPKVLVDYVDLRVFAHATEDPEKVLASATNLTSAGSADAVTFAKNPLTGHHGNSITLFTARIRDRKTAQQVVEKLAAGLSMMDKESLNSEIDQHFEKGNLYLRLDKQTAYVNEFKLTSTDPIHLRIHFRKHRQEEIMDICRRLGLLP